MESKPNKPNTDRAYYIFALKIIGDFGVAIALPVVVFVLIGNYFDSKYNISPLGTILGFILSALISTKLIYKKAKRYGREYEALGKK